MPSKTMKATPWEIAKPILIQYYSDGTVTDDMKLSDVLELREEFRAVKKENFRCNFNRIKKSGVVKMKEQQERDIPRLSPIKKEKEPNVYREAWERMHQMELQTNPAYRHELATRDLAKELLDYWEGSEAQCLLKMDIAKQRQGQLKPELLWNSRPEYRQEFNLEEFRFHFHEEVRRRSHAIGWITKEMKRYTEWQTRCKQRGNVVEGIKFR